MFTLENVKFKNIIDIDKLEIKEGEITCILGKSGSGKSTLLKLLNKIISPDDGKIYFKNRDLEKINTIDHRRQVPMLGQFPIIFEGNVRDNLLKGLEFSDRDKKSDQDLKEALMKVDLDKELDDNPRDMSGGEKQRLCIARIILMDTDIILLDEPSSSLDDKTEYKIIKTIYEEIKENKKTMVYITHSKEIAYDFSDTILILDQGKIIEKREENE